MMRRFEYALVRTSRPVVATAGHTPLLAALGFVVMSVLGWVFFFVSGSAMALRTHRIDRTQDQRLVRYTPWRRMGAEGVFVREGVLTLAMHRLKYRQESRGGGGTVRTTQSQAEVRWGPVSVAMVGSATLAVVVYFGLKRAGRVQR
jgi:hypothetical protein